MTQGLITSAYLVAAAFFIASLAGLSKQKTARRGNWLGILGMTIALLATIAGVSMDAIVAISDSSGDRRCYRPSTGT